MITIIMINGKGHYLSFSLAHQQPPDNMQLTGLVQNICAFVDIYLTSLLKSTQKQGLTLPYRLQSEGRNWQRGKMY